MALNNYLSDEEALAAALTASVNYDDDDTDIGKLYLDNYQIDQNTTVSINAFSTYIASLGYISNISTLNTFEALDLTKKDKDFLKFLDEINEFYTTKRNSDNSVDGDALRQCQEQYYIDDNKIAECFDFVEFLSDLKKNNSNLYQRLCEDAKKNNFTSPEDKYTCSIAQRCLIIANSKFKSSEYTKEKSKELNTALKDLQTLAQSSPKSSEYYKLKQRGDGNCAFNTLGSGIVIAILTNELPLTNTSFTILWQAIEKTFSTIVDRDENYLQGPFIDFVNQHLNKPDIKFSEFQAFLQKICTSRDGLWAAGLFLAPALRDISFNKKINDLEKEIDHLKTQYSSASTEKQAIDIAIQISEKIDTLDKTRDLSRDSSHADPIDLQRAADILNIHFQAYQQDRLTADNKRHGFPLVRAITGEEGGHWDLLVPKDLADHRLTQILEQRVQLAKANSSTTKPIPQPNNISQFNLTDIIKQATSGTPLTKNIEELIEKQQKAKQQKQKETKTIEQRFQIQQNKTYQSIKKSLKNLGYNLPSDRQEISQQVLKEVLHNAIEKAGSINDADKTYLNSFFKHHEKLETINIGQEYFVSEELELTLDEYNKLQHEKNTSLPLASSITELTPFIASKSGKGKCTITHKINAEQYDHYLKDQALAEELQLEIIAENLKPTVK